MDVEEVAHPDGRIVVFCIPGRPAGFPRHIDGKYLMRCGESLVPMSPDRLRAIILEGVQKDWLEECSVERLNPGRIPELLDTEAFFDLLKKPYPKTLSGIVEPLAMEGLIDTDGDYSYSIRRLGALLFARDLQAFPDLYRKAPRVIVYKGHSKISTTLSDETVRVGYAAGFQKKW